MLQQITFTLLGHEKDQPNNKSLPPFLYVDLGNDCTKENGFDQSLGRFQNKQ